MDLLTKLRKCVSDERELEAVFSFAAGGASIFCSSDTIEYRTGTPSSELFARVKFEDGRIKRIDPGPPLQSIHAQNALVEKARAETSHNHGTFVVSRVLFSARKLKGVYSWNDEVRLSPCPATAVIGQGLDWAPNRPSPPFHGEQHMGPPFPLMLEVRVHRSPNPVLEANRWHRQLDLYQYLFTVLPLGHIRFAHWPSDRMWMVLRRQDRLENHLLRPGFESGDVGRHDEFPARDCVSAPEFEGEDYYNHLWFADEELLVPKSLGDDLRTFHAMDRERSTCFVRACYWYALAIQFRSEGALATVAFSTAVECLLPRPSHSHCEECGKPVGPGPTQLFKRLVKRYGSVDEKLQRQRAALYDIRSSLVHGSHASRVDIDLLNASAHSADHRLLLEVVSQRSLRGWLRDPSRAAWHLCEKE